MKLKLFTLATSLSLIGWFFVQSSNDIEQHEKKYPKEIYISPDNEVPDLVKNAINSETLKELYKYNLNIFLWKLNVNPKNNYDTVKNFLKSFKPSEVDVSFGFKNLQDYHRYLDLIKKIKEEFKIDEMDETSQNEFLGMIRIIQLENMLNDTRVKDKIKTNKKLSEFVNLMMIEKNVKNRALFSFSCYMCIYDYDACLEYAGVPPSTYTEEDCYEWYLGCLEECDF